MVKSKKLFQAQCSRIEITEGCIKYLRDVDVSLDGTSIYVAGSKWTIKVKEINDCYIDTNDDLVISSEKVTGTTTSTGTSTGTTTGTGTSNKTSSSRSDKTNSAATTTTKTKTKTTKYRFVPPYNDEKEEMKFWNDFVRALHAKCTIRNFQDADESCRTSISSHCKSSRDGRHSSTLTSPQQQPPPPPKQPKRSRKLGVFGKNKPLSMAQSHHHNWDSTLVVAPQIISENHHRNDVEEEEEDENDDHSDKENEFGTTVVVDSTVKRNDTTKRRRLTKMKSNHTGHNRNNNNNNDDDEPSSDTDDDTMFTTPNVQRVVSPYTTSTTTGDGTVKKTLQLLRPQQHDSSSSALKTGIHHSLNDEETDDSTLVLDDEISIETTTAAATAARKQQPGIKSFFQPLPTLKAKSTKSANNSSGAISGATTTTTTTTTTNNKTPTRRRETTATGGTALSIQPSGSRSGSNTRNNRTDRNKTTRQDTNDTAWLRTSPARKLRTPQEKRQQELFGTAISNNPSTTPVVSSPSVSSVHRTTVDSDGRINKQMRYDTVLHTDPIQEFASSPRKHYSSKLTTSNHRSSQRSPAEFDHTTTLLYRPLDYSKQNPRTTSTLANRFADSNSTPLALRQHSSDNKSHHDSSNVGNVNYPSYNNIIHHTTTATATTSLYRKFRGLRNLGNTCYQNSSLQMLYSCRTLITALQKRMTSWDNGRRHGTVTNSICTIGQELSKHYMPSVNSRLIKDAMDTKTDKFVGYEQRDAHEFISDLIDFVHEELQSNEPQPTKSEVASPDGESDSTDNNTVRSPLPTDDFCMAVEVCLKCCSCGYTRNKEEMYRHLSIDVISDTEGSSNTEMSDDVVTVSMATVQNSLKHFFQPETREIKCEKCTDGTHAEQTLRIISQPKLLLLHLKRFIVVERMVYPATTVTDIENHPPNTNIDSSSSTAMVPSTATTETNVVVPLPQIEYVFKKNKAPIDIPASLSLDPFHQSSNVQLQPSSCQSSTILENVNDVPLNKSLANAYKLQSIVHHIGSRASSGHYTADAIREALSDSTSDKENREETKSDSVNVRGLEEQNVWVSFDDGITSETTIDKIVTNRFKQSTAYMLLYVSK